MKKYIKIATNSFSKIVGKSAYGNFIYESILNQAMNRFKNITHNGVNLTLSIPNLLTKYRAETFSSKEPETLEWIDGMPPDSVLWDIGANVGLYSCYAAKARNCKVFAFEPSVFNLELLARNIYRNSLVNQVTIVPLPLSDKLDANTLNMTTTVWGGALSTFGQPYGHDGSAMDVKFKIPTIGISMMDAVNLLGISLPDYIKMDVDGIEHLILSGGLPILKVVKGILIEINDKFKIQADCATSFLTHAGLSLTEKRHAAYFDSDTSAARYTFNQIWSR
jgi:FkbM family methyltransferase